MRPPLSSFRSTTQPCPIARNPRKTKPSPPSESQPPLPSKIISHSRPHPLNPRATPAEPRSPPPPLRAPLCMPPPFNQRPFSISEPPRHPPRTHPRAAALSPPLSWQHPNILQQHPLRLLCRPPASPSPSVRHQRPPLPSFPALPCACPPDKCRNPAGLPLALLLLFPALSAVVVDSKAVARVVDSSVLIPPRRLKPCGLHLSAA